MAVTYGFYNSSNGDRKYNALQFSRLFEGIIRDGVFSTVGGSLMVVAASNLTVNISPGRAWFNNTWTNNDALLPLTLDPAEAILNRYDAVVLEVAPNERENRFKIVKGTPATNPIKPVMVKSGGIYQYPLAYIYVGKGVGSISQANISNAVGTTECPFITGAMQQVTTNDIMAQWESEFNTWFDDLQAQLEGNVVTNLQNQINTKLTANGGDGKDVVVTFTEGSDVHIASGEKLSVIFGKLLGKLKAINTAIADLAPKSHAGTATTYGVGTTANYGHVKVRNDLVGTETSGAALSPAQGKALNDKINSVINPISGSVTLSDALPRNEEVVKTIPLGVVKNNGRLRFINHSGSALVYVFTDPMDAFSFKNMGGNGTVYFRRQNVSDGSVATGHFIFNPSRDYTISLKEAYLSGSNLILKFTTNDSNVSLNCPLYWEVW
jgi:hypothetical protein